MENNSRFSEIGCSEGCCTNWPEMKEIAKLEELVHFDREFTKENGAKSAP